MEKGSWRQDCRRLHEKDLKRSSDASREAEIPRFYKITALRTQIHSEGAQRYGEAGENRMGQKSVAG